MARCSGRFGVSSTVSRGDLVTAAKRRQPLVKPGQPLAVLGRDRHRVAEAEPVGFADPGEGRAAFGLVGDQHHRLARSPQPGGEVAVGFGHAVTRVDDEQRHIGVGERALGLRLHAAGERGRRRLFEPGGVDRAKTEIGDMGFALAAIAGQPGGVVDQRRAAADRAD